MSKGSFLRSWRVGPLVRYRDREHMAEVVERQMLARGLVIPMGRRNFLLASLATLTAGEILARQAKAAGVFGARKAAVISASGGSGLAFPDGFSDARYTGMNERSSGSRLNMSSGTTYNKYSWVDDATTTYSIAIANNAIANDFRLKTREGIRVDGGCTTTFNDMYMEVYGISGDHADGVQNYDPNGTKNTVTFNRPHFRGTDGQYTCIFGADNGRVLYTVVDGLFSSDGLAGNAIVLYNDLGGSAMQLAMDTVYLQATGWAQQQILINSASGTNPAQVTLWTGVRNCTWNHTTKILVPGSTITQPSGT